MENSESKLRESWTKFADWLNEQQWFQELKGKWDELDPQSRQYLKFAGFGASVLLLLGLIFNSIWSVHSLKSEVTEKADLLNVIQTGNDELKRLRESAPAGKQADGGGGPWSAYFDSVATNSGLDKANVTLANEKQGNSTDVLKESLFDLSMKKASIKQIVRFAFNLEAGARPVKLRNLTIDTKSDPSGYMDANMSVSAFTLVNPNK